MKRASFINRKNTQIREKGRVCQNKHTHLRTRSTCTYIKEYIHLYERDTCTYTKEYMRLAKKW